MREPTWADFFLRVGGVCAVFATVILMARYWGGHAGWAAVITAAVIVAGVAARELWAKRRAPRRRRRR